MSLWHPLITDMADDPSRDVPAKKSCLPVSTWSPCDSEVEVLSTSLLPCRDSSPVWTARWGIKQHGDRTLAVFQSPLGFSVYMPVHVFYFSLVGTQDSCLKCKGSPTYGGEKVSIYTPILSLPSQSLITGLKESRRLPVSSATASFLMSAPMKPSFCHYLRWRNTYGRI